MCIYDISWFASIMALTYAHNQRRCRCRRHNASKRDHVQLIAIKLTLVISRGPRNATLKLPIQRYLQSKIMFVLSALLVLIDSFSWFRKVDNLFLTFLRNCLRTYTIRIYFHYSSKPRRTATCGLTYSYISADVRISSFVLANSAKKIRGICI